MPFSHGYWLSLALCAAIILILILAYNLSFAAPPRHTQDRPRPRSVDPRSESMIAERKLLKTVNGADGPPKPTTTTDIHNGPPTTSTEQAPANQARNRPRVVDVYRNGQWTKRWAYTD